LSDKKLWQLKGVVTNYESASKPGYIADLGNSFKKIEPWELQKNHNAYEWKFFQKECLDYLDEYMLIDGVHLVRRVSSTLLPQPSKESIF